MTGDVVIPSLELMVYSMMYRVSPMSSLLDQN